MSALLRVLIIGDNSNILLYASRFRFAKSVELYYISQSESNYFRVNTLSYGHDEFEIANHFKSIAELEDAMRQSGENGIIFDLIILSSMSLQQMSSLTTQLNPMININSKIFLESSGFVQLEQFVKMTIDLSQLNIFSIVTDYDFRQVGPNEYRQFGAPGVQNCIYLGDSTPISPKKRGSGGMNSGKYPKNVGTLLVTFQKLFEKLFPRDKIDLCNGSQLDFLSTMWTIAIPKICFDPLLILLEESDPQQLSQQVLAKPLISGLVTEVITILKSMGAKLPAHLESENELLSQWQSSYADTGDTPAIVYHFIERTSPLNIDMVLLQPILLADDYYIKTPYLEFLYSAMCQYQKLNDGNSKWFIRREDVVVNNNNDTTNEITLLSEENDQLQFQLTETHKRLDEKELTSRESESQVHALQKQIASLREIIVGQSQKQDALTQELKQAQEQQQQQQQQLQQQQQQQQQQERNNGSTDQFSSFNSGAGDSFRETSGNGYSENYEGGGTPDMRDIENIALLGVNYGEGPQVETSKQQAQQARVIQASLDQQTPPSKTTSVNGFNGTGSTIQNAADVDRSLKERELEIRRKELELQEKELNFQKRAVQQQQRQQQKYIGGGGGPPSPTLGPNRRPSYQQLQQTPGLRPNRTMHGASPGGFGPHGSSPGGFGGYGDPMAAANGKPYNRVAGGPSPYGLQAAAPLQPQNHHSSHAPPHASSHAPHAPPHAFKPTSRKNRQSNMPTIGSASSVSFQSYSRPALVGPGGGPVAGSHSTGNLPAAPNGPMGKNIRKSSFSGMNYPGNGSNPRLAVNGRSAPGMGPMAPNGVGNNNEINKPLGNPSTAPNNLNNPVPFNAGVSSSNNLQVPGANNVENTNNTAPPPQPIVQVNGETKDLSSNDEAPVASTNEQDAISAGSHEEAEKTPKKKKFGLFGKKKKSKK